MHGLNGTFLFHVNKGGAEKLWPRGLFPEKASKIIFSRTSENVILRSRKICCHHCWDGMYVSTLQSTLRQYKKHKTLILKVEILIMSESSQNIIESFAFIESFAKLYTVIVHKMGKLKNFLF